MKLIVDDDAVLEIDDIADYISQDSAKYAIKTLDEIYDKIDLLKEHPKIGKKVPELNDENIRELQYKSYRIIYRLYEDYIRVETVFHGARDFNNVYQNQ